MLAALELEGMATGRHRVRRLMSLMGLQAIYQKPNTSKPHPEHRVYSYKLRGLAITCPNHVWGTDITFIRTHEGWLYLAAVIHLYSRKVVGWSMASRMQTSLAFNALLMAVKRRKPTEKVIVHSDQGSQVTSHEWCEFLFLTDHNLEPSMSRRSNCYDNAITESFFHLLKTEHIRRKTYKTRVEARQDVFDYIELFYNPKRRHGNNGMLSPVEFDMAA